MAKAVVAVRAKRKVAMKRMVFVGNCRNRGGFWSLSLRCSGDAVGT